jgi:pimeloyl-ACP methyl ester carboxylesterase
MTTFVLVHPAWFGGWCWRDVTPSLRAGGHDVYAPTLTGLGERAHLLNRDIGLNTHVQDVVETITSNDLQDVVLVGNSSGGTVITAAADQVPDRVTGLIYLDAFVPADGESTSSLIPPDRWEQLAQLVGVEGDGWLLPRWAPMSWEKIVRDIWQVNDEEKFQWVVSELRPTPLTHFTDPVSLVNTDRLRARRSYIRCRTSPAPFDKPAAIAQNSSDWTYRERPWSHVPFITQPAELAQLLLEVGA